MTFDPPAKRNLFLAAVVVLYVLSVAINLGFLEMAGEEPRRALISIEMFHSGVLVRPTLLGWDYLNKPPFFNWVLTAFIWLTGSASEFVLRLPSLIAYLAMAYIHYRVARHFFSSTVALLSSFFILTCGDVYFYGLANGAEIDIFYSLLVYVQAISIFWFFHNKKILALYVFSYLFCALGFLTKAFPSILFQGLTLLGLCVYARSVSVLFRWQHLVGLAVFAGCTALYLSLYSQYHSPYLYLANLLNEALLKSAIGEKSYQVVDKSILYPFLFLKMLLPWSLFLFLLVAKVNYRLWQNPMVRFSILFILFNIGVYWFTGQPKIRYVYMFLPFACTIFAAIYEQFTQAYPERLNKILKPFGFLFPVVMVVILVLPFFASTQLAWVILLACAFFGLTYGYFFQKANRIWMLLVGILLIRLTYAALFIPIQYKGINNYKAQVNQIITHAKGAKVVYTAEADAFPVRIQSRLFHYDFDTIAISPVMSYQVPYYYYLQTKMLMRFSAKKERVPVAFSYASQIKGETLDTLYHFFDWNMGQEAFIFRPKRQTNQVSAVKKL